MLFLLPPALTTNTAIKGSFQGYSTLGGGINLLHVFAINAALLQQNECKHSVNETEKYPDSLKKLGAILFFFWFQCLYTFVPVGFLFLFFSSAV